MAMMNFGYRGRIGSNDTGFGTNASGGERFTVDSLGANGVANTRLPLTKEAAMSNGYPAPVIVVGIDGSRAATRRRRRRRTSQGRDGHPLGENGFHADRGIEVGRHALRRADRAQPCLPRWAPGRLLVGPRGALSGRRDPTVGAPAAGGVDIERCPRGRTRKPYGACAIGAPTRTVDTAVPDVHAEPAIAGGTVDRYLRVSARSPRPGAPAGHRPLSRRASVQS